MTTTLQGHVRSGWRVFVGADEVGEVEDVGGQEITIKHGTVFKRSVRLPLDTVTEAAEGIVDLRDDDRTRTLLD